MALIVAGHTNTYHTYTLEQALDGIARAGYSHAELTAVPGWAEFVRPNDDPVEVRQTLDKFGLDCIAMSLHLEPNDEASVNATRELIDWSGRFGLSHLNCALGQAPADNDKWVASITELASRAADLGVSFNIEVHGPLARTGAQVATLLDRLGNAHGGINYDTGNVEYYGGITMEADLPGVIDRVRHLHLKDKLGGTGDWAFPALGGGHVDFTELRRVVSQQTREIAASVELEFHGEPWPSLTVVDDAMMTSRRHLEAVGLL